jgi:predicted DsbA family dithiol-disulfide isomerase
MNTSPILAFDFLDPWGWIGVRRLAMAMNQAGKAFDVTFQPCRSSLSRIAAGMSYAEFLERRFGTQALIHQSLVTTEMQKLGMEPAFSQIRSVPDTRPALAAVLWLQRNERSAEAFVQRVYEALYCYGENIGDDAVLEKLLSQEAVAFSDIKSFLLSDLFSGELQETETSVAGWAGRVIPSFRINGTVVFGAQTPGVLAPMFA